MSKLLFAAALMALIWYLFFKRKKRSLPDAGEAHAILGLDADARVEDIKAAHRRLIAGVHPDKGGSAELARRITDARDVLLRRLG